MGTREEEALPGKKFLLQVIIGALKGLLVSVVLAAVLALIVAKGALPSDKALTIAMLCALVGVFFGSFSTVRKHRGKRWLLGLAVGFCAFVLLFIVGFIFSFPTSGVAQMMVTTLVAGLLGGLPGAKRKHRSKR